MFHVKLNQDDPKLQRKIENRLNALKPKRQEIIDGWQGDETLWAFAQLTDDEIRTVAEISHSGRGVNCGQDD
jgi:hypothetical protein